MTSSRPFTAIGRDDAFATTTLRRSDGRTVTLVAVMHVAPPQFWALTQAQLDTPEAGGAAIHCEGVGDNQHGRPVSDVIRDVLIFAALRSVTGWLRLVCGWQRQRRGLTYRLSWETHDVSTGRALAAAPTSRLLRRTLATVITAPLAALLLRRGIFRVHQIQDGDSGLGLIDDRNRYAIDQALAADRDVALLWGAGHIPGMVDLLEADGFRVDGIRWRQFWPDGAQPNRRPGLRYTADTAV
ncbi:hypothetical protein [Curtobacterium sp. MCBD17_040]|uniref:hypothetical protein n=1 Tax=Curtobacterium sp. MCBD17_040 TaxID=2175674 RepID=UPI000DA81DD4|nr:hypothetical protein [Curtobacterium sp. MCBD17_040]WIB65680.1 hypothetical protein DEI94_16295 [Curtobacterium sp. MCBD17_040]